MLIDNETDTDDDILRQEVIFRVKLEREMRNGWSAGVAHLERINGSGGMSRQNSAGSLNSQEANTREAESTVPSILICINGQFESLLLVKESLREKVTVLIFAVSEHIIASHFTELH